MKIRIRTGEQRISLYFPTWMITSKSMVKLWLRVSKKYSSEVPDIPPHAIDALCDEMKRIKKTYGTWELVDVQSAGGKQVKITL